jgi:E3 ubiquitin-protein ligase DOA10
MNGKRMFSRAPLTVVAATTKDTYISGIWVAVLPLSKLVLKKTKADRIVVDKHISQRLYFGLRGHEGILRSNIILHQIRHFESLAIYIHHANHSPHTITFHTTRTEGDLIIRMLEFEDFLDRSLGMTFGEGDVSVICESSDVSCFAGI